MPTLECGKTTLLMAEPTTSQDEHSSSGVAGSLPSHTVGHVSRVHDADGFFTLVDQNPFGVYVVDADFRLARVSLGAQKVFANIRPLLGRDFADILQTIWPEPFATYALERFRHTLSTGEGYVARDASPRGDIEALEEYDWRIERLSLPDGRLGVVCFFYDLSERARRDYALRESESRLRLATDAADLGIWSWHSRIDTVVWENARPYDIFGLSLDEPPITAARFAADIVLPAYRDAFVTALGRSVKDRTPFLFEGQIRRADGATRWIEVTGKHDESTDSASDRLVGTVRDVTAARTAEAHVREIEERSAFVRRSSGVGFWYCNLPFDVLEWDDLVKAHFHLPPEAVVTIQTFYDRIHPDDRERTRLAIERSITEHSHYDTHYRTVHPDTGVVRHVRAIGRTFYATDGTPTRFDGVTLDVSEQTLAEASLRDADRRKDQFLAMLSHELRNPLAPLRTGLDVIRMAGTNATIERTRAMMERQVLQLQRLVDDLLDVSRVTSDKVELRPVTVDLRVVIDAAMETCRPFIDAAGVVFSVAVPDAPLWVHADVQRLAQVVSNLLHNSAKYTPRGGHIWLTVMGDHESASISVADDGIGIPPAMLDTVFELFAQVDHALEKSTGGLGIGLSLVKRLVELHGGRVEARSRGGGQGSTFVVQIPVVPSATLSEATIMPDDSTGATTRRRILLADDNVDAAEVLGHLLTLHGHEVSLAHDGAQAVAVAEAIRPDIIVLDIGMPTLNGYDAARRIRGQVWGHSPVLVALTGWGHQDHRTESVDAGFDHHLVKPVDLTELLNVIASGRAPST